MRYSPRAIASKQQQISIFTGSRRAPQQWLAVFSILVLFTVAIVFSLWHSASASLAAAQSPLNITTVAGSSGGTGLVAGFLNARGIAAASPSVIYVADTDNHVVRKVDVTAGTITIFAGKVGMAAMDATAANGDGTAATDALLNSPSDVALDANGNVYISDSGNRRIRKVTISGIQSGQISTVAGSGVPGSSEGSALGAVFTDPRGLAFDANGRLFVADAGNHRVTAINDVNSPTATVSRIAGNGAAGNEGDGGPALSAGLSAPTDVAVDGTTIYIADTGNHKIRIVSADIIGTFAGTGSPGFNGEFGAPDTIQLNSPSGVAVDAAHKVIIADTGNHRIRQADTSSLTPAAGKAGQGYNGDGTPATNFTLNAPNGAAVAGGQIFFMDSGNNRLRKIAGTTLSTVASDGSSGFAGDGGLAINAKLDSPAGVAVDNAGNYYIADTNTHVIRKVNASDKKINRIAGTPNTSSANPNDVNGDGGTALEATFNKPTAVAVDAAGNIYVADTGNNRVRKIGVDGIISTLAGIVNGVGTALNGPSAVAADTNGSLYIADPGNHVIRRVATNGGAVTVFAGQAGLLGYTGDGSAATGARLNRPSGVAVSTSGDVFIADTNNHRIRRVFGGTIATVVSQGLPRSGFEGDGNTANVARLNSPWAVYVDSNDNLYINDRGNNRIRRVTASDNIINTIIGNGEIGLGGDGGPATQAKLSLPGTLAVAPGTLNAYVADSGNNRIRLAQPAPNSPPSLTSPGNKTVNEGQALGFTVQATDPDSGQAILFSMTNGPAGSTFDNTTGVFSYTPGFGVVPNNANATQSFTVTFTATDNGSPQLSDSKTITITVNNVNRAPVVDSGAIPATIEATSANGASFQLNGTAIDPDGDPIASIVWTDTRPGPTTTTIATQLSAPVVLTLGAHSILLTASDNKPNGSASTTAKVVTVQDTTPPVFSNILANITQTITSGTGANVTFSPPTAIDAVSGNRTVTAAPASGAFFPIGMTTVTFTASDAVGNTATTTFQVTVVCNGAGCGPTPTPTPTPTPPPTPSNFDITIYAGSGAYGNAGTGGVPANASFKEPRGVAVDLNGTGYVADAEARVIRKISQGTISLLAGTGAKGFAGDGGAAASAKFNNPTGLALDIVRSTLYVADTGNHRIRKIDLATGNISTVAGNGVAGIGAAGQATSVPLNAPEGVAVDAAGNIYIADTGNNRVCKVVSGQLTIIAGTGEVGTTGDGGAPTAAKLNHPTGVAVTSDGASVYIVDQENHRIRKVAGGTLTGIAGTGTAGFSGDGGLAASAQFNAPTGIALDAGGNLLITDTDNERIRKVTISDGKIATIAGNGNAGNTGDGGAAVSATLDTPTGIAVDASGGYIVFCDTGNLRVRRLSVPVAQNNPPVPAALANQSLNKNQQLNVALSATDADNDPVTFTLVPSLAFVSITNASPAARTATLFINPNNSNVGVYSAQIKADDGKGAMNLTPAFTITVNDPNGPPPNQPPVAVANQLPASVVAQDGQNATVHLDGSASSDPNGDALTYAWKDNGQQIATTAVADVPLAVGQHSIVLTVNDGKGGTNSTAAQSVTVTAPPPAILAIDTLTPNNAKRGTTVTVIIAGSGFMPQSVVSINGGGITVTLLDQTPTQLTVRLAIAGTAQASNRNITVTNADGTSVTKQGAFQIKQ